MLQTVASDCCFRLLLQTVISALDVVRITVIAAAVQTVIRAVVVYVRTRRSTVVDPTTQNRLNICVIRTFSAVGGSFMSRLRQEEKLSVE